MPPAGGTTSAVCDNIHNGSDLEVVPGRQPGRAIGALEETTWN